MLDRTATHQVLRPLVQLGPDVGEAVVAATESDPLIGTNQVGDQLVAVPDVLCHRSGEEPVRLRDQAQGVHAKRGSNGRAAPNRALQGLWMGPRGGSPG